MLKIKNIKRFLSGSSRSLSVMTAFVLAVGTLVAFGFAEHSQAATYNSTSYGQCSYGYGCLRPTTQTTPTGLKVSINLESGQTIPRDGYEIKVTPLNGSNSTFEKVEFYLDGVLVYTATPGSDGTARWNWVPRTMPGSELKSIVFDTDGSQTVYTFSSLKFTDGDQPSPAPQTTDRGDDRLESNGGFVQQVQQAFTSALEAARDIIRTVPAPVVYSFPYFLLFLLLINVLLLLAQARKELEEYRVLQKLMVRGRAVNESKKTLAQLVSHYLRTPLTLMMGGVDMMKQDPSVQSAVQEFQDISSQIHLKVEGLITETVSATEQTKDVIATQPGRSGVWKQPGLFLPMFMLPLALIPFNYVAATAGTFTMTQVNYATQIIIFAILITMMYIILRARQLRTRHVEELREIIDAETAVNASRDNLISNTVAVLDADLTEVDALLARVGNTQAAQFIAIGQSRYREMLSKLRVANRLKGLHSDTPYNDVSFTDFATKVIATMNAKAAEKSITLSHNGEGTIKMQSPELVAYAVASLLDNAIAYSKENSNVELTLTSDSNYFTLNVVDHGEGIPAQNIPMLFQPFVKTEGAEVFTHEGMGFSLYIDKLIAEYVHGSIDAASKPNDTTTFSLHLPTKTV